jgi:hypothetical protein
MISWRIQIDMLLPPELHDDSLYQVSLEQAAWADKRGLCDICLSEQHGSIFISSPLVLGRKPGPVLGPSYLHEMNYYGKWAAESSGAKISYAPTPDPLTDVELARSNPAYAIVTPQQCIELAREFPDGSYICQHVNKTGIHTDMSWESPELFVNKVMPHIQVCKPEDVATPAVDRIPWAEQCLPW